eukprot:1666548-Alexandrium_andersonii.AAC.1
MTGELIELAKQWRAELKRAPEHFLTPLGQRPNAVGAMAPVPEKCSGRIVARVNGDKRTQRNESRSHGPPKSRIRAADLASFAESEGGGMHSVTATESETAGSMASSRVGSNRKRGRGRGRS